jgi:hypothetical protein
MVNPYGYVIDGHMSFDGMPNIDNFNPYDEQTPLYISLLLRIGTIPIYSILIGKTHGENLGYKAEDFRQYEFDLDTKKIYKYAVCYLYIKKKDAFFKHQSVFEYPHNGAWQKIPLVWKTMSNMSEEELGIIYTDLD